VRGLFEERVLQVPWTILAAVAAGLAGLWLAIAPEAGRDGWRAPVLRWGHGVAWAALALAATIRARVLPVPARIAGPVAIAGGAAYAAFLAALTTR
jgi:peptidoglycan/LPS O-acetylase OafA/YrhL